MLDSNILKQTSELAGIADNYVNATGGKTRVEDKTIVQLLEALGYDTSSNEALQKSANKLNKKEILASTIVCRGKTHAEIELNVGASIRPAEFTWRVVAEQGQTFEGDVPSQLIRDERGQGGAIIFALPAEIEQGYHKLQVMRKRRKSPYEAALIITPQACYKQPEIDQGKKLWGPSVQLYTLRSYTNWGIGDFSDLKELICEIAERGGEFIGLNPIHSLFPANPVEASPYSPSSRRWINTLYVDVTAVPEYQASQQAQQIVTGDDFQARLHQTRANDFVNYQDVSDLKMSIFPILYSEFKNNQLAKNTERATDFLNFVEDGGESLKTQAAFDALHIHLNSGEENIWGCPKFPEEYQSYSSKAVQKFIGKNQDQINMHMYLQWVADEQIKQAQALAKDKGMTMGLYRDLAVGVARSGTECWSDDGSLVMDASIGAPPDILGPQGQNWGLPPLNPLTLKETGYSPFIKLLQANMKHCGALRIDHVLGLLRLWLVPNGMDATEGAYVYYPVQDMLAILALESHRHQCSIIGEDLGTVPDEITSLLQDAGIHSYKVFFFETSKEDGGYLSPSHYLPQSMSTLCTHDMPTLLGYWHCLDLELGQKLGIYPDEHQLNELKIARLKSKQGILDSVAGHGNLPDDIGRDALYVPMDSYLSEALQIHMAAGSSSLLSVQLEDWLEMEHPVNIPGTSIEYPNWSRKLSTCLEDIFKNENVNRIATRLTETRRSVR